MIIIRRVLTLPRIVGAALAERLKVMPAVVVMGARQTGKSTLAEHLVPGERHYASLDDLDVLDLARRDPEGLGTSYSVRRMAIGKSSSPTSRTAAGGTLHVNMATISAELSDELAARLGAHGCGYIAAPVLERPEAAVVGRLNIIAAGPGAELGRAQPLLDAIGRRTWRLGERAARANVVKLAVNFMLAAAIESMGEAAALCCGYGIEAGQVFELVSQILFPGPVYEGYGRLIAASRFEPA